MENKIDADFAEEIFKTFHSFQSTIIEAGKNVVKIMTPVLRTWLLWNLYCQLKELQRQKNLNQK